MKEHKPLHLLKNTSRYVYNRTTSLAYTTEHRSGSTDLSTNDGMDLENKESTTFKVDLVEAGADHWSQIVRGIERITVKAKVYLMDATKEIKVGEEGPT